MKKHLFSYGFIAVLFAMVQLLGTGCANMIPPTGGPKDSLPPRLMMSLPKDSALNVTTNKIVLTFDEYVDIQNVQQNLIVSPVPKNMPLVDSKLRTVTIKLRDSLEPNTTYSLNFANSIKDVNEGNPTKNFTYVFSTGKTIDNNTLKGKVTIAQTGKYDSTLLVVLQNNLSDTAIYKVGPRYYTTIDKEGNFSFKFLPKGQFNIFVLPNEYSKKYDDSTKTFAFADDVITIADTASQPIMLYAYNEAEKKATSSTTPQITSNNKDNSKEKKEQDKRLKFAVQFDNGKQDLLNDSLKFVFNRKLKAFDSSKVALTDTNYKPITNYHFYLDTNRTNLSLISKWKESQNFIIILQKDAVSDSAGVTLSKADTVKFSSKKESEYGAVKIRFTGLDVGKNPVLQIVKGEAIVKAVPLTSNVWSQKLFPPGEYELRLLFDNNKNGVWDPGNYKKRRQPEKVQAITKKINIRANWDNESEIKL